VNPLNNKYDNDSLSQMLISKINVLFRKHLEAGIRSHNLAILNAGDLRSMPDGRCFRNDTFINFRPFLPRRIHTLRRSQNIGIKNTNDVARTRKTSVDATAILSSKNDQLQVFITQETLYIPQKIRFPTSLRGRERGNEYLDCA